jgi:hypothetical protein
MDFIVHDGDRRRSVPVYNERARQKRQSNKMRKIMKKSLLGAFASIALLCFSTGAWADSVSEVFECKFEKGATLADAQAVNSKWLAFMKANVSEDITSLAATVLVGKSDEFLYVDSYPDLATWAAAQAALETDEGQAFEKAFNDVIECEKNTLYSVQPTE